jgi:hypothetical protein
MTAHFLQYSAVASNLTPKLHEWEIVEVIDCHYPAYVQRTILSAGVKTIRDALNLLNRLESLETERRGESNPEPFAPNFTDRGDPAARAHQDENYRTRPGFQNVRNMRYQGTRNNDRNRQPSDHRQEWGSIGSRGEIQDVPCRAVSSPSNEGHGVLNPDANGYSPRSNGRN